MEKLVLVLASIVFVYAKSTEDAPPIIEQPPNLNDPRTLVIIGNSSHLNNKLLCGARNADSVVWEYRKHKTSNPSQIPQAFRNSTSEVGNMVFTELSDEFGNRRYRSDLNGYYQCFARNSQGTNGYTALTPPIRLIIPVIVQDAGNLNPLATAGNKYAPFRIKCLDNNVIIDPSDLMELNVARYSWQIFYPNDNSISTKPIQESDRVRIDQRTGDLYFAYLEESDHVGSDDLDPEYQCLISLGDQPRQVLGSRTHLTVNMFEERSPYVLQAPISYEEKRIVCNEGSQCILSCAFGGMENGEPPDRPIWTQPVDKSVIYQRSPMSVTFTAIKDAQGTWRCSLPTVQSQGEIDVTIRSYPLLTPDDMKNQFVEVGSEVEFVCSADSDKTTFYINGQELKPAKPSYVDYKEDSKVFKINNVQRDQSSSVACMAENKAGISFKTAQLSIYNKPQVLLRPEGGYSLNETDKQSTREYSFICDIQLDQKTRSAEIYWQSDHPKLKGKKLEENSIYGVIKILPGYLSSTKSLTSELRLFIDSTSLKSLPGYRWWCGVDFSLPGMPEQEMLTSASIREPFGLEEVVVESSVVKSSTSYWWIIGVVAAILFFILLIILIVCCVQQNKGEQYYVDEKERRAGHDPKQELDAYGFTPYKRPATGGYMPVQMSDQDPIKGSRVSMDISEKPLDSDTGSMDEYGDIDPGRFNEDGSFIGQYGKLTNNMDV